MAEFFARLVPKKSTQPGEVPNPDLDLIEGEIAVNTADGKIWTKHSDGTLVPLGGEAGEGGSVGDVFRRTAQFWGTSKKTTDTPAEVVGAGAWCVRTDLQGITVSEFSADGSRFDGNAYSSGSTITLTVADQEMVFTLTADPTQVVDQLFTFEFTEDTTSLNNLLNGTDLVAIGLVKTDAEEGDILVWSDACQCWLAEPPEPFPDFQEPLPIPVPPITGEVPVLLSFDETNGAARPYYVTNRGTYDVAADINSGIGSVYMDGGKFGPGYFNGLSTSMYMRCENGTQYADAIDFGTGDFTIEFWLKCSDHREYNRGILGASSSFGLQLGVLATSATETIFTIKLGPYLQAQTSADMADGEWHHVAVTRASGSVEIWVDGVAISDGSLTSDSDSTGDAWYIGSAFNGNGLYGQLDEFRIIKGQAYYTEAFTPSDVPLPVSSPENPFLGWDGESWVPMQPPASPVTSVNGQTGDVELGVMDLDDVTAPENPLTEGDTLQWDDTAKTWRPVQLVDQDTGILNIQEAGDYKPQQLPGTILANEKGANYTDVCGKKWIFDTYRGDDYIIGLGKDHPQLDEYKKLEVGDEVTFTWPDATQTVATVGGIYSISNTSDECYLNCRWFWFLGNDPAGAQLNGPLKIESVKFTTAADVPLVEGDMLQWDDSEQAFRPVQLDIPEEIEPGISKIQDADDFKLQQEATSDTAEWTVIAKADASDGLPDGLAYGGRHPTIGNVDVLALSPIDLAGTDRRTAGEFWTWISAANKSWQWLIIDGVDYWFYFQDVFDYSSNSGANRPAYIINASPHQATEDANMRFHQIPAGSTISWKGFNAEYASSGFVDVPLAPDDILRWDNGTQAFMPAQLSAVAESGDYNDLANTPDLSLKADLVGGKIPADQLPAIAVSEFLGTVADEAAMLALTGQSGDWCVRVDTDSAWILSADDASVLANWIELGGGAGNVVSVNSKTGAVSLGIQDMDDFGLYPAAPGTVIYEYRDCTLTDTPSSAGQWCESFDGRTRFNTTDSNSQYAYNAALAALDGAIWWRVNGGEWTVTTFRNFSNYSGNFSINISGFTPADYISEGAVFEMSFTSPDVTLLAEGDILQWNSSTQQFKPAQLPEIPVVDHPVTSVNEKTGDVSLGIQDMNDLALLSPTQTPGYNWDDYLDSNQKWDYAGSGKYALKASSAEDKDWFLTVCSFDGSNVDRDSDWATVEVGDQITFSEDGTAWHTFEVVSVSRNDSDDYSGYVKPVYSIGIVEVSAGIPDLATWTGGFYTDPLHRADFQPLADGDHLQWNNAEQKFNPVQLATVAETGSYNDLADVPAEFAPESHTHRIQDADDYKPQLEPSGQPIGEWEFRGSQSLVSMCGRSGDAVYDPDSVGICQVALTDLYGDSTYALGALIGRTAWVEVAGVQAEVSFSGAVEGGSCRFYWGAAGMPPINLGDRLKIWPVGVTPPEEDVASPLVEGDILRWSVGHNAFRPEPLNLPASYVTSLDDLDDVDTTTTAPTDKQVLTWDESQLRWMPQTDPASPVRSVQDKTGDVRLTIQEMDDFHLAITDAVMVWNRGSRDNPGEWSHSDVRFWHVNHFDADGVDQKQALIDHYQGGGTFWISTNNDPFLVATITLAASVTDFVQLNVNNHAAFTKGGPLRISFVDPGTGEIPLANDDVLFWNDDATKFIPRQLSYNDLGDQPVIPSTYVESINNLDGVVTFGMNDLNDVVSDYTPDNRAEWTQLASGTPTNRAPKNPGQWGYFEGGEDNRQLRLNYLDGVDNDWSDAMASMPASGTLYVSQDDVTFLALPYRAKSHNTSDGYWSFFVDPYVPPKVDGSLFVSLQPPESPNFQPFAQGSHLEFTGALWQPVQLATVAKSGSYEDLDDKPVIPVPNARVSDGFLAENLPAGDTANGWLDSAGKAGMFISVTTDRPAWVRFYTDDVARADDVVNRPAMDENPTRGSGVLLEVITDGTSTYNITPVVNYFNNEGPDPQGRLAVAITNTDGDATFDIQLTVKVLPLEV